MQLTTAVEILNEDGFAGVRCWRVDADRNEAVDAAAWMPPLRAFHACKIAELIVERRRLEIAAGRDPRGDASKANDPHAESRIRCGAERDSARAARLAAFAAGAISPREIQAGSVETTNLHSDDAVKTFATGARRSTDADGVRYDLVSPIALRRLAETYAEGAAKYGPDNWRKGIPAADLVNHAMRHVELFRAGDRTEDHLAHAAWNLFTLMHFDEAGNPSA